MEELVGVDIIPLTRILFYKKIQVNKFRKKI